MRLRLRCGAIREQRAVRIVEDVLPSPAERQQVFWKTSNTVLRLCLADTESQKDWLPDEFTSRWSVANRLRVVIL